MSIARLLFLSGVLSCAACSSATDPGGDLAVGNAQRPSAGPGHPVPITPPCHPVPCQINQ
jgi:hypothetical protein